MIFSSWTYDKAGIDYFPHENMKTIGNKSFIENEGWGLLKTLGQFFNVGIIFNSFITAVNLL